jgi:hypothetical protein
MEKSKPIRCAEAALTKVCLPRSVLDPLFPAEQVSADAAAAAQALVNLVLLLLLLLVPVPVEQD